MSVLMLAVVLAVGPVLDPIAGEEMTAADRELLPSGRHLGSMADLWMVEVVSQQHNGGGIASFDPLQLSAHGLSWTQMRTFVDGIDISDPARPGAPLLRVPHEAWTRLRFESLWSDAPGFRYQLGDLGSHARVRASVGGEVGGPLLLPAGFMDREPAYDKGVNPDRRALESARELVLHGGGGGFRVHAEGVQHARHYPTLISSENGAAVTDTGERSSLVISFRGQAGALPVSALVIGQLERRSHLGANDRWPEAYTRDGDGKAAVAQLGTELDLPGEQRLRLRVGWGFRSDVEELRTEQPMVRDIEDEWLWMARPRFGEELARMRFDGNAELDLAPGWSLSLRVNRSQLSSLPTIPGGRTGATYRRGASGPADPVGVSVTVYDPRSRAEEWLGSARLAADGRWSWGGFDLRAHAALDWAAVGVPGETRLSFVSPALGLAGVRPVGGAELFALVRREPEALTSEVSAFLDRLRPSGNRHAWIDDGDRVPEAGEAGALLARTGGRYHRVAADLRRPASNQLVLGVRSGRFGPFRAVLSTIGRLHTDRFTVVYNREVAESFVPVPLDDPGGDGRGEGDAEEVVYERVPGTEGEELYVVTNAPRLDFYAGASAQLYTVTDSWWFLNLGAVGYWSIGAAPFGAFPDRDDQGIIDEVSADPNLRVSQRGRPDSDRAFGINLIAGVTPWQGVSAATAIRYRDGQPFVRMVVADDLPQGPTPIMAVWRGAARHTFHMTVDARLRYRFDVGELWVAAILDGFNLLGSSVEILEDPRTGSEFRRPIEMVPGRTVMASVEMGWR